LFVGLLARFGQRPASQQRARYRDGTLASARQP
jgi:hypothetical protein